MWILLSPHLLLLPAAWLLPRKPPLVSLPRMLWLPGLSLSAMHAPHTYILASATKMYKDKLSLTPDSEKVRRTGCSSFASSLKSGLPLLPPLLAPHHSPVHQSPAPFLLLQLSHWQLGGRCLILIFNSRDDSPLPINLGSSPPRFPSPRQFCLVG